MHVVSCFTKLQIFKVRTEKRSPSNRSMHFILLKYSDSFLVFVQHHSRHDEQVRTSGSIRVRLCVSRSVSLYVQMTHIERTGIFLYREQIYMDGCTSCNGR